MSAAESLATTRTEPGAEMTEWLAEFERALGDGRADDAAELFGEECYWRDLVSFTWNIKTCEGRDEIRDLLRATLSRIRPRNWQLEGEARHENGVTEAWVRFETETARGRGIVRLREGRCWTLLTTASELKRHEERTGARRVIGTEHGARPGRVSWQEHRRREEAALGRETQPYCLVVGGGQAGIALGATLRRLGVPALVIDRNERAGDSWRNRYEHLCLHDGVWYNAMPYLPYPDDWPVFCPKDKMGDFLEAYTKIMDLNYWGGTECVGASFDEAAQEWRVEVVRNGERLILRPKQLVFAVGNWGVPSVPQIPGTDVFTGDTMHSSAFRGGAAYRGKKCVVIGAGNSAHDICQDLWENGAEVTMVQRSTTLVVRSDVLIKQLQAPLYSEAAVESGLTPERADMIRASYPARVLTRSQTELWKHIREQEKDYYARLEAVGFRLDFAEDGAGISVKALRRGSGWYIDEGATELIVNGDIALRHGSVASLGERSVALDDGSELEADLVVFATGYEPLTKVIELITSAEVVERVGVCGGIGSGLDRDPGPWEGELRNFWTPTGQDNLWLTGGGLATVRFYSHYLGLQLKARMEKLDTTVYGKPDPAGRG